MSFLGHIVRDVHFKYSVGCLWREVSLCVSIARKLRDSGDLTDEELDRVENGNIQPDEALFAVIRDKPYSTLERFLHRVNEIDQDNVWYLIDYRGKAFNCFLSLS